MPHNDPYQYGQRVCLNCGITIHTAPAVIVGQHPRALHLDFGVCAQGHTYCRDCNRDFPKDSRAYPLCPCCGAILGSFGGLKVPPDESLRVFRNADSPLYAIGRRSCFFCDTRFFTASVHTLNALPAAQQTRYYACRAEHIACPACQDEHGAGQSVCMVDGCGLPLEPYLASRSPLHASQEDAEPADEWLEVKYLISAGKGRIDSADGDFTFHVHDGSDPAELERALDAWLEMAAQRNNRRFLLVGKSYNGGWTYADCRIPFARQKAMPKPAFDGMLATLDLQQKSDFVRLRSRVLAQLRYEPSPRLLSLSREDLFAAFDKMLDYAKDRIASQGLDTAPLDNPSLLAEDLFEAQQEWENAEACHLLVHDYGIVRGFSSVRAYLPAIRYKCAFCCLKRQEHERAYRYLRWARDILDWNADPQFRWLPYRVHGAIAAHHQHLQQWQEAVAAGRLAVQWAETAEHQVTALYYISEAYRHSHRPDQAFVAVEEALQLCDQEAVSDTVRDLVNMSYGLLKSLLEGEAAALAESIQQARDSADPMAEELWQLLHSAADRYGAWCRDGEADVQPYLQTLAGQQEALLNSLAEKLPEERLKTILALLPALGETRQYETFDRLLQYGLHTARSKQRHEDRLRLERLGLKRRSLDGAGPELLRDYAALTETVENRLPGNERLGFYAEYLETYGRCGLYDASLPPLLEKMRAAYLAERNSMPTMAGRLMVRAMQQRYLETAIVVLAGLAVSPEAPPDWAALLTGFLELAKGQGLRDYSAGFARQDYRQHLLEHPDYAGCRAAFYQALEDFQYAEPLLRQLKTVEASLRARYFQSFALEQAVPRVSTPADTALIHYFFVKECAEPAFGLALVYYRDAVAIAQIPAAEDIRRRLDIWKRRRYPGDARAYALYVDLLERPLQALAFAGYADAAESTRCIGIVPDDVLHELPFAALCPQDNGEQRLLERYAIFYLHSLAHYREEQTPPFVKGWYGFGEPLHAFAEMPPIPLEPLPHTGQEVFALGSMMGRVCSADFWQCEDNTKARFLECLATLRKPAVLHLAVHGYGDAEVPEYSSVFFSTHRPDGARIAARLSFREILELDLRGVELVVLSACQTAVGKNTAGEGAMALSWAFQAAGAAQVVATQWPVPDKAAYRIMAEFYRHWLERGDVPTSLALAQRGYVSMQPEASPLQWAGFLAYR